MAKVIITESFFRELHKRFPVPEAEKVLDLLFTLESQPRKGKALGSVAGIVIKEIKYGKFRFYFITDGHQLKFGTEEELSSLIIRFVRMSDKKDQQKVIAEIERILKSMGFTGL